MSTLSPPLSAWNTVLNERSKNPYLSEFLFHGEKIGSKYNQLAKIFATVEGRSAKKENNARKELGQSWEVLGPRRGGQQATEV